MLRGEFDFEMEAQTQGGSDAGYPLGVAEVRQTEGTEHRGRPVPFKEIFGREEEIIPPPQPCLKITFSEKLKDKQKSTLKEGESAHSSVEENNSSFEGVDGIVTPYGYQEEVTQGCPDQYYLKNSQSWLPPAHIPRTVAPQSTASKITSKGFVRHLRETSHRGRHLRTRSTGIISRKMALLQGQNIGIMVKLRKHLTVVLADEIGFEPRTAEMLQRAIESCQLCNIDTTPLQDFQEYWLSLFQGYVELKTQSEGQDVTRQRSEIYNYKETLTKALSQINLKSMFLEHCLADRAKGRPCRLAASGLSFDILFAEVTSLQETKVNLELVIRNLKQEIVSVLTGIDFSDRDVALQDFVESMNENIDQFLRSGYLQQFK